MPNIATNPPEGRLQGKKFLKFIGIIICIGLAITIVFCLSVFKEVNRYRIVITPGNPSAVSIELEQ